MKSVKIIPSKISGVISASPSKSQTLRAILFAMMAQGTSVIYNYLNSPDTFAMIEAVKSYGASVTKFNDRLEIIGISGKLNKPAHIINAQNSGIILRFIGAIAGTSNYSSIITGDNSIIKNRVISPLLEGLRQLGVYAKSLEEKDRPPFIVKGPIIPNKITINGEDSQPVSALIIAAAFSTGIVDIEVINPGEKPWIDLTLSWLDYFNIKYENNNYSRYKIYGKAKIKSFNIVIPADFSSISFPIVAALITNSEITIQNIDFNSNGGDKKFIDGIKKLGAKIEIDNLKKSIRILKNSKLIGTTIDVNDFIDSLPILGVLGCFCEGTTKLKNANIARFKESNRITSITTELRKLNASIEETDDGIIIKQSNLVGATVHSHNDHRIAMSLCIIGLVTDNTTVENIECIKKSYPLFFDDLKKLNAETIIV